MRGALAVLTALTICAGCQDLHGVEVIVQPGDPAVTSVRLFVGAGGSTNSSLTTSSRVQVDDVEYWSRDTGNESDVVTGVDGTGEVKFLFDTSDAIPVVIAVGYDANHTPIAAGALTDLELQDSGGFTGYELPLLGPVAALGQTAAAVQLGLWSPDQATSAFDAACAGVAIAGDDHPYFVVTDNDQDCDGLTDDDTEHECTPDAYLGTRDADPSEASCLVSDQSATHVAQCRFGGSTCTDNVPRDNNTCVATHTCTVQEACTKCVMDFGCVANAQANIAAMDHYECALPRKASDNSLCQTTFTLARPPTSGYGCKNLYVGDDMFAVGTSLTEGSVELDATLQDSATSSCAGKLAVKLSGSTTPVDMTALVSFTLKNNAAVALPIHVTTGTGTATSCPQTTECAIVPGNAAPVGGEAFAPPLSECAATWSAPTPIANLITGNSGNFDPTLSADQLELIYGANSALYRATRTAPGGMWGASAQLDLMGFAPPPGSTYHAPRLSPDGLQMFFTLYDPAGAAIGAFYTTRSTTAATGWALPAPVMILDASTFSITSIAWGVGTHVLVGTFDMTAGPMIYEATWDATAHTLSGFMTLETGASNPYLSADGMQLYFDTTDTGGAQSIFVASRRNPTEPFAAEVKLAELASAGSMDTAPWVPAGAHTIYFTSKRSGSLLPALYQAQRVSF